MSTGGYPLKLPLQMDILLVSGRGRGEEPHPSRERAASLTRRDLLNKRGLRQPGSAWSPADTVTKPDLQRAKRLF